MLNVDKPYVKDKTVYKNTNKNKTKVRASSSAKSAVEQ